ncbi:amino acid ABC transporter permease/ATP-binding protein [Nakamurella flavida]|uniref:Amino acid ABC transporter permease/ATP-binding protein n=1 Tax=Nakamurella flavida TaxID=363630 RepID=A0A939BZS9_9ACTN|nr:amino acid ABC transporter permease/ATP-binding protein [Nakamurella flavida]MBM9476008.1 amino acid ABC transporter permease/ATP-binding protein [Nakamurella flavida]MDP9777249.1 polar amino acid transport system permease protein [Nakamurella flavida]
MSDFLHYLSLPYLLDGMLITLQLTAMGFLGGLVLGLLLAAMLLSRFRPVAVVARAWTTLYRGTPLILQLVFVFTVLPHAGVVLPPLLAGGVALALNEATFFAEIFRSGVREVDAGQKAAGRALGMTPAVLMRRVVGPQALRAMVPALGNEAVSTMKNSALASIIAVPELTLRTQQLASATFDYFSIYFATAVMYLVLTGALTLVQLGVERAMDPDRRVWPWQRVTVLPSPLRPVPAGGPAPSAVPDEALVPVGRLRDDADRAERAARTRADPPPRGFGEAMIQAREVRKSFGDTEVLRGIDLTVRQGEVVALLGPSGSGKSTLLRTLNHLEGLNGGSVLIGDTPVGYDLRGNELAEREVARQRVAAGVGMVFQTFNLFHHLTARENIAAPLRWVHGWSAADATARADELLDQVGMADRADALPRQLSGGQQQRVGIARALAARPAVLLLDEPTSALDPERVAEVLQVITALARDGGLTMVIATHQLRFAREVADRVVFMAGGVVVEEGLADDVIGHPVQEATRRFVRAMDAAEV